MSEKITGVVQLGAGSGIQITWTAELPDWVGNFVPRNLVELAEYVNTWLGHYRNFPVANSNYMREVVRQESPGITYTQKEPDPRLVAGRLVIANVAMRNAHHWLDRHRVAGRPVMQAPSDDLGETDRRLSNLLSWV